MVLSSVDSLHTMSRTVFTTFKPQWWGVEDLNTIYVYQVNAVTPSEAKCCADSSSSTFLFFSLLLGMGNNDMSSRLF